MNSSTVPYGFLPLILALGSTHCSRAGFGPSVEDRGFIGEDAGELDVGPDIAWLDGDEPWPSDRGEEGSFQVVFQGWVHIQAIGRRIAQDVSGMPTEPPWVYLEWNPVYANQGSVESYNLYRSTESGQQDFLAPLATGIGVDQRRYTDLLVQGDQTYYYVAAPVIAGQARKPGFSADLEVKVMVPPDNMVLVHRWMANAEMCGLLKKPVDRDNHYRCIGACRGCHGGYLDLLHSLFVDTVELGCSYSPPPSCGDALAGCLGLAAPDGAMGSAGDVFYNRQEGRCYLKTTNGWEEASVGGFSQSELATLASNRPGLPPLNRIDQARSQEICNALSVGGHAPKRLMRRTEFIEAAAWDAALSDPQIDEIESGPNLADHPYCNSNGGSGIAFDDQVVPAILDSLPWTQASGFRALRTGSLSTRQCVSRYGAQDLVGNVWEWTSDQFVCDGTTCIGLSAEQNSVDSGNDDFNGVRFDDNQGPTTSMFFADAPKIELPIGIPIVGTYTADGVTTLNAEQLHQDYMHVVTGNGIYAAIDGGGWYYGGYSGRYLFFLNHPATDQEYRVTARCCLEAD